MRIEEINKPVPEQSNPTFLIPFKDETGAACVPETLTWDLSTMDGTVIALNQSVVVPAAISVVTLTTAQTRFLQDEALKAERLLSFYAVYNSTYGVGLITRKQVKFTIEQFLLIGYPLSITVHEIILTDDYPRDIGIV